MVQTMIAQPEGPEKTVAIVLMPQRFERHLRQETLAGRLGLGPAPATNDLALMEVRQ